MINWNWIQKPGTLWVFSNFLNAYKQMSLSSHHYVNTCVEKRWNIAHSYRFPFNHYFIIMVYLKTWSRVHVWLNRLEFKWRFDFLCTFSTPILPDWFKRNGCYWKISSSSFPSSHPWNAEVSMYNKLVPRPTLTHLGCFSTHPIIRCCRGYRIATHSTVRIQVDYLHKKPLQLTRAPAMSSSKFNMLPRNES